MKKKFFLAIPLLATLLISCGGSSGGDEPSPEPEPTPEPEPEPQPEPSKKLLENDSGLPTEITYLDEPSIMIHYQRYVTGDAKLDSYTYWDLWLWGEGKDGAVYPFNYSDDYGVIAYYPVSELYNSRTIGFIVKQTFEHAGDGNWQKDYGQDRFMDLELLTPNDKGIYEIYLASKNKNVYTDSEHKSIANSVSKTEFTSPKMIEVEANNPLDELKLYLNGSLSEDYTLNLSTDKKLAKFSLEENAQVFDAYRVYIKFADGVSCERGISIRKLYTKTFEEAYYYDGELGAIYSNEETTFKVWSPVSQSIDLYIYKTGTPASISGDSEDDMHDTYHMVKGDKGVFSYTLEGNWEGAYYTYFVTNAFNPNGKEVVDPYAKSAGISGLRGMVVDFSKTNPLGWEDVDYLHYDRKELTVYETHIAELTCSDTWGGNSEYAKKFPGFYQRGTTYEEDNKPVKTGFDHIRELGVNAVQIIPIFDQANDETNMSFNWGYNPLNYNVVEGGYSTNPYDGYQRIREFKELVQAYNGVGITIIMDVVYNHVNGLNGSNFDVLMPYYYFRYNDGNGSASNGSGCGNETASDHLMFRKFMIDSTCFWTKEYKLGGFRFDLMGLHDLKTMELLTAANLEINPYDVIYGEPWAGGTGALDPSLAALQVNAEKYVGYGQFNDIFRDAMIMSGMKELGNKGWVDQTAYAVEAPKIVNGLKGITFGEVGPDKTVTYASCHDNYTLHDRIMVAGIEGEATIKQMSMLANSLVFTSQGTGFMLAGEEFNRTKIVYDTNGNPVEAVDEDGNPLGRWEVSGNSYSSSYKTNELDYSLKIKNADMFGNYKELVALKRYAEGLHTSAPNKVTLEETSVKNTIVKVEFKCMGYDMVAYHTSPANSGDYVVDTTGYDLYLDTLGYALEDQMTLHPCETLILFKK